MAAVAPSADQATDLMKNMSLESQTKASEISEATKKPSTKKFGSFDMIDTKNGQIPSYERSTTPQLTDFMDPNMCYLPNVYPSGNYYYGAYDGTANEWDEYSRYLNGEGLELSQGVYGENGSMMYHHGYGYAPYGPYSPAGSPVPTVDGQLYGAQHYQYPTPYFPQVSSNGGPFTPNAPTATQGNVVTSAAADQKQLPVESANGNSNGITNGGSLKGNTGLASAKSTYQNSSYNSNGSFGKNSLPGGIPASGYQDPRFGFDATRSPVPWADGSVFSDGQARPVSNTSITSSLSNGNNLSSRNQNMRPQSHLQGLGHPRPLSGMSAAHGFVNRMYPNKLYAPYGNAIRSHIGYGSNGYDSRTNGRGWYSALDTKYKPRGRGNGLFGYGNESADGMNELNRGPRAKGFKTQKVFTPITLVVKGQEVPLSGNDEEKEKLSESPDREQYNSPDFAVDYDNAKFYIIKSYSEDDVHKSIKYNVWASTPNGNKKLDSAYQEAQEKSGGCPIFLFYSVNTSGQFVGLAEMVGPVDFNKNLEFWQQDKWNGCFSLKWHIVKDVPNTLLKHIILENNENKPVTNSRDCQEVKLEQGLQMLKIFKDYSSKTSLLDDFAFYEGRQKAIQEKKAKNQLQKQAWEGKSAADEKNKEATNGDLSSMKTLEVTLEAISESTHGIHSNGEVKVYENGSLVMAAEGPKGANPVVVAENRIVANGVTDGC